MKRRLGCINIEWGKNRYFNVKSSLENIIQQLRLWKQRTTNVSPFEAHFGRKINTTISLLTSVPSNTDVSWDTVKKNCLDYDTFGSDKLIDDWKWKEEDLSDEKIERNKDWIRQATSNQNLLKLLPSSSSQPVNPSSTRIKPARKISNVKRGKSLEGLYETEPEGSSKTKYSDSTVTIRVPGRHDMEVHKEDLAKFVTSEQRNTPLEHFIQPVDKNRNATVAMVERMQKHVSSSLKKLSGKISIRKQSEIDPSRNPSTSKNKRRVELKFQKGKHQRQLRDKVRKERLWKSYLPTNV